MRIAVVVVVGLVGTWQPRDADACSCGMDSPEVSPVNDATAVPRNAIVIVRLDGVTAADVVLRDATSAAVAMTAEVRRPSGGNAGTTLFARPTSMLAANSQYELVVKQGQIEVTTTFTTGDAIDATPPAFSGIVSMSPETMTYPIVAADGSKCISSCIGAASGHISRIHVDYPSLPADAVHTVLQLYRRGESVLDEVPLPLPNARLFGYLACVPQSPPGVDYCARMVAYDIAGNAAGLDTEVCATAAVCAPRAAESDACQPSDECVLASAQPEGDGGCASTHANGFAVLGLLALRRRRRR